MGESRKSLKESLGYTGPRVIKHGCEMPDGKIVDQCWVSQP